MSSTRATMPRDLLSVYDVMYMLDVRIQRIYSWRRKLKMPFHHISGTSRCPAVRYSLREIVTWTKKNKIVIKRVPMISKDGKIHWSPKDEKKYKAFQQGIEL